MRANPETYGLRPRLWLLAIYSGGFRPWAKWGGGFFFCFFFACPVGFSFFCDSFLPEIKGGEGGGGVRNVKHKTHSKLDKLWIQQLAIWQKFGFPLRVTTDNLQMNFVLGFHQGLCLERKKQFLFILLSRYSRQTSSKCFRQAKNSFQMKTYSRWYLVGWSSF